MSSVPVSVVIPAFNREATIARCMDSILAQDVRPQEILVIDDGSTDKTISVASSFGELVRVIRQPRNAGAQAARNRGIREATQPWIAFQDSDDEWMQGRLSKQWTLLMSLDLEPDLVFHSNCLRCENGTDSLWNLPLTEGPSTRRLTLTRPSPMFQGMLVSKELLQGIGLLDEQVPSYQEWETSIRLAAKGRFHHIQEPLFRYHFHKGPTISKDSGREASGYHFVTKKHELAIRSEVGEGCWRNHMVTLARLGIVGQRDDLAKYAAHQLGRRASLVAFICRIAGKNHPTLRPKLVRILSIFRNTKGTQDE